MANPSLVSNWVFAFLQRSATSKLASCLSDTSPRVGLCAVEKRTSPPPAPSTVPRCPRRSQSTLIPRRPAVAETGPTLSVRLTVLTSPPSRRPGRLASKRESRPRAVRPHGTNPQASHMDECRQSPQLCLSRTKRLLSPFFRSSPVESPHCSSRFGGPAISQEQHIPYQTLPSFHVRPQSLPFLPILFECGQLWPGDPWQHQRTSARECCQSFVLPHLISTPNHIVASRINLLQSSRLRRNHGRG